MCPLINIGVGSDDFKNNALADLGQTVTHVPSTETEDFRGNKTFVFSGTTTLTAIFHKREKTYIRDKKGVRQLSPAYLMHNIGSGIKKGDKIIVGSGTGSEWKVHNILNRRDVYQFSDLYLWS